MGYESRVIVVDVMRESSRFVYAEEICSVKMSCMTGEFHSLFKKEIDYTIVQPGANIFTNIDKYGEHIKSCDLNTIIEYLEKEIETNTYRRLHPLLGLLKGFEADKWHTLEVLHYGY